MASNARAERRRAQREQGQATNERPPVVVATLSDGNWSAHFGECWSSLFFHDGMHPLEERMFCRPGGGKIELISGPRIAETRSKIVDRFLHSPTFAKADWLMTIDSDMTFTWDDVARLVDVADPEERPIVGGLCFAGISPESMYPTVYTLDRDESGRYMTDTVMDYPRDQVVKVGATGAAFMLIHRSVLVALGHAFAKLPNGEPNPYPWYAEGHVDSHGRPFGEDIVLCLRAQGLGFPVHIDTSVKVGHHKSIVLTEQLFDEWHERLP